MGVVDYNGRPVVHLHGMRELSKALSGAPKELRKVVGQGFKDDAEPVADRARQLGMAIADSGDFASSIKITGGRAGVYLQSNDPGAGPIEFAHPGALATSGPGRGEPIGVPSGFPARALFPAIEQTIDDLALALEARMQLTLDTMFDRQFTASDF